MSWRAFDFCVVVLFVAVWASKLLAYVVVIVVVCLSNWSVLFLLYDPCRLVSQSCFVASVSLFLISR